MALSKDEVMMLRGFLDRVGDGTRPIRGLKEATALAKCSLILQREQALAERDEARASLAEALAPHEAPEVATG